MAKAKNIPITPSVLAWAIEESGYSLPDLAGKLHVEPTELASWASGTASPTLTEFRKISTALKRPSALFFLPSPPPSGMAHVDFRHPPEPGRTDLNPVERRYIREARRLQKTVAWALAELGAELPDLPRVTGRQDPEAIAVMWRSRLGVTSQDQLAWPDSSRAFKAWRKALQDLGILVFLFPLGERSCRGLSIWNDYAPLIAINTAWQIEARIFTLFHELGHLLTRTDSACIEGFSRSESSAGDPIERWCERFAAAILMPWDDVQSVLTRDFGWSPGKKVVDIDIARKLARRFSVSARAAVLRLIEKNVSEWPLYNLLRGSQEEKPKGGGGKGRTRTVVREDQYGERTRRVLIDALNNDVMTRLDVLRHLDIPESELERLRTASQKSETD